MKKLITTPFLFSLLLSFLITSGISYSQSYVTVYSSESYTYNEEGKYDNLDVFYFSPSIMEFIEYKFCIITFYVYGSDGVPLSDHRLVRAITGYDYKYVEDEVISNVEGQTVIKVSTDNLSRMAIVVCYNGPSRKIQLQDVAFSYHEKKYLD